MKKLILTASLAMIAAISAFGQGQVILNNNANQSITNISTGAAAAGGAAQDDTQVGLYVGNVGDAVSSLSMIGSVTNCFAPGRFNGGTRTLAGWNGTVQLQVRAWLASTVYPSYEAAVAGGIAGDISVRVGVAAPQTINLAAVGQPLPSTANGDLSGNPGMTPIVLVPVIVPEPSSIALGLLGLGAVALFRRRK